MRRKHVGYVAASAWSLWMFPKAVSFVARSSWIHPILMTTFPAGASLRALSSHQYLPQDEWLVFWYVRPASPLVCYHGPRQTWNLSM